MQGTGAVQRRIIAAKEAEEDNRSVMSSDDDESSLDHHEGKSSTNGTDHDTKNRGRRDGTGVLANRETKGVFCLRIAVFACLFAAAAAVSVVVFLETTGSEQDEFEAQFEGAALKVLESFNGVVAQKVTAMGSLGVSFTSYARSKVQQQGQQGSSGWPFVTMNDFQQRAAAARKLSDALFLEIVPIVTEPNRLAWEEYSLQEMGWVAEGRAYQDKLQLGNRNLKQLEWVASSQEQQQSELPQHDPTSRLLANDQKPPLDFSTGIGNQIYTLDETWSPVVDVDPGLGGYYTPIWQSSPVLERNLVNFNLLKYAYAPNIQSCYEKGEVVIGGIDTAEQGNSTHPDLTTSFFAIIQSFKAGVDVEYQGDAMSSVYYPVFDSYNDDGDDDDNDTPKTVVAVLVAVINWATYFENILPYNTNGVVVVLENSCDGPFTYEINGPEVLYLGKGDLHDSSYNHLGLSDSFAKLFSAAGINTDQHQDELQLNQDQCLYSIRVYPSKNMEEDHITNTPLIFTFCVGLVFFFTAIIFVLYDRLVERRQRLVMNRAVQSTAIVSSLFPAAVRDKLIESAATDTTNKKLSKFLNAEGNADADDFLGINEKPIADFFPHCTVLFADIAGFTAWSSSREPAQVFILLQTVYQAFDAIAKKYKVFKVETIGDSYVAVTGLPDPQAKHAILMARFAQDCMEKMAELVKRLEVSLGPDTGELTMRFGMHSGPVTAGVLRGDRARFQLFGDTVNTAARMESTGIRNRIQASQSTVDLLIEFGKNHWVRKREDVVEIKGKGVMTTYWLTPRSRNTTSIGSSGNDQANDVNQGRRIAPASSASAMAAKSFSSKMEKQERLIEWNAQVLLSHLRKVIAHRNDLGLKSVDAAEHLVYEAPSNKIVLDEVKEVIQLPKFDAKCMSSVSAASSVEISEDAMSQLRNYVSIIASMYHDNSFHNFEHASHVCMSVDKFLKRISSPDIDLAGCKDAQQIASQLHDYTNGITSDPLTLLAVVFSALIHDCNHKGVSNMQLIQEDALLGKKYHNKSVAEQNSVDLAWELLMKPDFGELRRAMFGTKSEMIRFRQVVVNVVLATDIFDKELNDLRKNRWNKVFADSAPSGEDTTNSKATIVIEHIIQASDVAHTMQHWHIYRKWNERLFHEMYTAYRQGRMAKDPSTFWVQGELVFFDNYVIPLAKKLEDCRVFGVSSDECINYAKNNRKEWETKGAEVVAEMVEKYRITSDDSSLEDEETPQEAAVVESIDEEGEPGEAFQNENESES